MDFTKSQKKEFIQYIAQINKLANERQKKERFLSLLERIFSNNRKIKNIIDKFTGGAETYLTVIREGKKAAGYADTQYENVVVEFENNLKKTEEHARSQLLEYLSAIYKSKQKINYKLISSDGIKWIIYYFDSTEIGNKKIKWNNNNLLKKKNRI